MIDLYDVAFDSRYICIPDLSVTSHRKCPISSLPFEFSVYKAFLINPILLAHLISFTRSQIANPGFKPRKLEMLYLTGCSSGAKLNINFFLQRDCPAGAKSNIYV